MRLLPPTRHNIPVIQVVINNHVLGMVRQWQNLFYEQRYSATVLNDAVDFVKLAEAMGAEGVRASTREEFKEAFAKALKSGHPVVIDCQIDSDDKVWPMVAPGAPISEAFDEKRPENKKCRIKEAKSKEKWRNNNEQSVQFFSRSGRIAGRSIKRSSSRDVRL